ncbi:hypothetical protein [Streptomyces sp. NPDC088400]|uniref:hypothetical protein n=1 Tax=Streptomyces sp. NPDC088400 TaxID=3365861 RepID=UPI003822277C
MVPLRLRPPIEAAVVLSPPVLTKIGRARQCELKGFVRHARASATALCLSRLRCTSTTGTVIRDLGDIAVHNASTAYRNNKEIIMSTPVSAELRPYSGSDPDKYKAVVKIGIEPGEPIYGDLGPADRQAVLEAAIAAIRAALPGYEVPATITVQDVTTA